MKKALFAIILICLLSGGAYLGYRTFSLRDPILPSELTLSSVTSRDGYHTYPCVEPTAQLVARCQDAGGAIQYQLKSLGIGPKSILGCYPVKQAKDEGKKCVSNWQCQGECLWLAGDMVVGGETKTCSKYQEPYFIYPANALPSHAQGLCDALRARL